MPSKQAIQWAQLKVGVVLVIAITIMSAIVVLVLGTENPFASRYTLFTYLPNIGGMRPDSVVMVEGVEAGKVETFGFVPDKGIRVKMRVQRQFQDLIRTDSIAKLRSLGLLGDKYIEITQGTSDGRALKEGEIITGAPPLDLDQMIAKATHTFDNMSDTVDNIKTLTEEVKEGKGNLGRLFKDDKIYKNASDMIRKLNEGQGSMARMINDGTLYQELSQTAENLRKVSEKIENGESPAGKLLTDKEAGQSIDKSIKNLETILARIQQGEGSLGKLSTDPALYNSLTEIANNLKPITADIAKGQGSLGALVKDKQLYDNTNKFLSELVMLVHDVREDPKKYLRVKFSVF
jgi:phospholipid/cholesterol/gamma-HCH transport system substrate-binding protein